MALRHEHGRNSCIGATVCYEENIRRRRLAGSYREEEEEEDTKSKRTHEHPDSKKAWFCETEPGESLAQTLPSA